MSRIESDGRDGSPHSAWPRVLSIAAATFLLVTTEFLPFGLPSPPTVDLRVTDGTAGLAVTSPGVVAAVAAVLMAILAKNLDGRAVIVVLTAAIVLSNLISAVASSFEMFLIGRLELGLAVGGLWTFAIAVGRGLVTPAAGARATSIISAGTVFGMPVGAGRTSGSVGRRYPPSTR